MIRMTLCPKCRTIQKAGTVCTICRHPVSQSRRNGQGSGTGSEGRDDPHPMTQPDEQKERAAG